MASTRRQLSPEELEDAARLRSLLEAAKKSRGLTQEAVGLLCGWAGQQAVQAYLGNTPINLDAAFRFSKALEVPLDAISPRLAAKAVELFGATVAARQEAPKTIEALLALLHDEIEGLSGTEKESVAKLVKFYEEKPSEGATIARTIQAIVDAHRDDTNT